MKEAESTDNQDLTLSKQQKNPELNPRKAATKLKQINKNVQIMRNRFKVLQVQDQYHRYRTLDQQKRIIRHKELHSVVQKDKQALQKQLEKVFDISEIKERSLDIKTQIKDRLQTTKKKLIQQRIERSQKINQQCFQNEQKIKKEREKYFQFNKSKKKAVLEEEQKKKEKVMVFLEKKIKVAHMSKSIDCNVLMKKADKKSQELSRLMLYEQQLIKKNSESLQASQLMKAQFTQIFPHSPKSSKERFLPEISKSTNHKRQIQIIKA